MSQRGPHELTLADIAGEAGVTAGRLVQRSAASATCSWPCRSVSPGAPVRFRGTAGRPRAPLATVRAYAACMADLAATPEALLRNLAYLQLDLADDDAAPASRENARATRREIRALEAAVAAGELRRRTWTCRRSRAPWKPSSAAR